MQLKSRYKETQVGLIPEEWRVCALAEIAVLERGKFTARPRNDPKFYGGEIPFIQTGDVRNSNGCISSYSQTLNALGLEVSKLFPANTLFFTIAANIGDVGIALFETAATDSLVAISTKPTVEKRWLYYELRSRKRIFESLATQNAQMNINLEKLRPYQIPIPTLPEQHAIATALSEVDALIDSLDRLIAKKRNIKQAAMQQLLSGKTRLPGFEHNQKMVQTEIGLLPEDWQVVHIRDIATVKTGPFGSSLHERDYVQDGTPIITVEHLGEFGVHHSSNLPMVSELDTRRLSAYLLDEGDLVFSRVGSIDRNALIRRDESGWLFSGRLLRIRPDHQKTCAPYLSYQFHSEPFKQRVRAVAVGQTMPSLNTQIIKNITIALPSFLEQKRIASVFLDIDADLLALDQRRRKTALLKQGMMQELLTGRKRLI